MRHAVICVLLACLCASALAAGQHRRPAPTFNSVREVEADAAHRLALTKGLNAVTNQITYEGDLSTAFLSGSFGALLLDNAETRFECDNNSVQLGCSVTAPGNHLLIFGHLRTYLSCRHDATDDEAVVDLLYRRVTQPCGDLICTSWQLLTH